MSFAEQIRAGEVDAVRAALARDPALASASVPGAPSPILLALYVGRPRLAEAIREVKATLDLFEAAAMGDQHQIGRALDAGTAEINAWSADGFTPLGYAAFFGHLEAARMLLDRGANPNVASRNPTRAAPLHSALAGGHKQLAALLIERGADVDAASDGGWTPLHYAADAGDVETAGLLLDHCERTDARRADGKEPAEVADERGFSDLGELLRPKGA